MGSEPDGPRDPVVEDIEPFGIDGRSVFPHFRRTIQPALVPAPIDGAALWPQQSARSTDVHAGFIGRFRLSDPTEVELQLLAVDVFRTWLDGERLADGPARFAAGAPAALAVVRRLDAGEHRLAVHVHGFGVRNRILPPVEPFLWCRAVAGAAPLEIEWAAAELRGYIPTQVRTSSLLGWVEWCDTRVDGRWWEDDALTARWEAPARRRPGLGPLASTRAPVPTRELDLSADAKGTYRERRAVFYFPGHEIDDPVVRMATTDLSPPAGEEDGGWLRYDLGRVRSGTIMLELEGPAGAEVLIGLAERLADGRLIPAVSPGRTCFVSRFLLAGGVQEIETLAPNGARHLELRLAAGVRVLRAAFVELDGLGPPAASFECGDQLLERIWSVGAETMRAAAEDALIDSIRERAQWTGDTLTVGLEIGAVGWSDLSLFRQALLHAAECANREGMVAGCGPGDPIYLSTYAAYWISAAVRYFELSGDRPLLTELLPAAEANLDALRRRMLPDGSQSDAPWPFVDWGHAPPVGRPDPAWLAIVLAAARDFRRWQRLLGADEAESAAYEELLASHLRSALPGDDDGWRRFGFHATVWALRCGLVAGPARAAALETVMEHLQRCFPNHADAPRLRNPGVRDERVITPFFAHFSLGVLLEAGETDFVLGQWRRCWGWMLDQGATTWWEVFDEGWSHCHFWSGSPTWQMSRYLLGLWPRWDRGPGEVELRLRPGSLARASGTIALPGGMATVAWRRSGQTIHWSLTPTVPLRLARGGERTPVEPGETLELGIEAGAPELVPSPP